MIKEVLKSYISLIKEFQLKLAKKYDFDLNKTTWSKIRTMVPEMSKVDRFTYRFHGAGCRIEKDNEVCEFDYAPIDDYPIKFVAWKLLEFMNSNSSYKDLNYNEKTVIDELNKLLKDKILAKLKIGDFELNIYQISQVYYNNPQLFLNQEEL